MVRTALQKQVPLFSHLPQYERESSLSLKLKVGFSSEEIHPAILRLGLQFASGSISGSNSRCVAMLTAFKQFISDYQTPPAKVMRDDLLSKLKPLVRFLIDSRPQSISMGNAIRYLKLRISKVPLSMEESQAKAQLIADIDSFITERIEFADEVIAAHGCSKINDGDVILTYATSHVVELLLKKSHAEGKRFRLIIVDSRPKLEGKELLRRLVEVGIQCTYIMINALSYVMREVDKVFLGAAALLSNGTVISRVGTALVAMMAHRHNVPLLVCCETYKFHERVQLDSIGFNELGDPDELITHEQETSWSAPAHAHANHLAAPHHQRCRRSSCPPISSLLCSILSSLFSQPRRLARHAASEAAEPGVRPDARDVRHDDHHRGRHDPADLGAGRAQRVHITRGEQLRKDARNKNFLQL